MADKCMSRGSPLEYNFPFQPVHPESNYEMFLVFFRLRQSNSMRSMSCNAVNVYSSQIEIFNLI